MIKTKEIRYDFSSLQVYPATENGFVITFSAVPDEMDGVICSHSCGFELKVAEKKKRSTPYAEIINKNYFLTTK